jgi:hypothetical protein
MQDILAQIVLARRNEDVEGWMNILFVVVLAVFWALGGILKARSSRSAQSRQKQPLAPKLARRPPPSSGLREQLLKEPRHPAGRAERRPYRPGAQEARTKLAELRAAARKFAAEAEQAFRLQMAEAVPEPQQPLPKPRIEPSAQETPESAARFPVAPQEPDPGPLETPPEEYLAELLSDYADSDHIRRAILHYEILGKPLSLRDPSQHTVGF